MSTYQSPNAGAPELTLGWRLRMALEHSEVTVEEMMAVLGVKSRDTIAAWTHDRRHPKAAYLRQWALRTGVPFEWLETGINRGPDTGSEVPNDESGWTVDYAPVILLSHTPVAC